MSSVSEFLKGGHYFELYQKALAFHKEHANMNIPTEHESSKPTFETKLRSVIISEIEHAQKEGIDLMSAFAKGGEYFEIYQKAFAFHKKHAGAKTMAEWRALVSDCAAIKPGFESKLMHTVVSEIERAYKENICKEKGDIE